MTTPAQNVYDTPTAKGEYRFWDNINQKWGDPVATGDQITSVFADLRPESVNSPVQPDGYRAPTNWTHVVWRYNCNPVGNQVVVDFGNGVDKRLITDTACFDGRSYGLPTFPSGLENAAISRALLAIKNQRWQPAENLKERKQTVRLITDKVKLANGLVRNFKKEFPKDWRKILEYTGRGIPKAFGRYLELVYGIVPLWNDVYGLCQDLADREKDTSRSYRASVIGRSKDVTQVSWDKSLQLTGVAGYRAQGKLEHHCKVHLDYCVADPELARAAHLGLTNPAAIVWNVTPWTYVADWILPVGKYLEQLDATLSMEFLRGSVTRWSKVELRADNIINFYPDDGGIRVTQFACVPYHELRINLYRYVLSEFPSAPLPTLKSPVSMVHLMEAISLLQQNFRR